MTKDEALKMALEALEDVQEMMTTSDWFNERVQAVRQALAEPEQPVSFYVYEWVNQSDGIVFRSFRHDEHHMGREPDRTIAFTEPDTGIDRGAWSDVPDATKWVDELRGDEDLDAPPNSTTDVVEPVAWVLLDLWKTGQHWPDDCFNSEGGEGMTPLYTAPIKRKGGQYAKECEAEVQRLKEIIDELENDDSPPKREWVGLTDEEILEAAGIDGADTWVFETAYAIEAKLKEKNRD